MQFDEVISNRKTIRKYISKEVPKGLLLKIINSTKQIGYPEIIPQSSSRMDLDKLIFS